MTLGEKIKQYRDEHGMSARYFAKEAGLSNTYISTLERGVSPRGDIPVPSIDTYRACARVMGITADELVRQVDDLIAVAPSPALSSEETELVTAWRNAEEPIKVSVRKLLDIPAPSEEKEAASSISKAG